MINRRHFKELVQKHLQQGRSDSVSDSEVEAQMRAWVQHYGSERKVYDELCIYFSIKPEYDTSGGSRFNNSTVGKSCDCGAKHTSFPNFHSDWCSVHRG